MEDIQRIIDLLKNTSSSEDLQDALSEPWLKKYQKWLTDSPEKIAAYLAIFYTLMQIWSKSPIIEIDYNQFNIEYNQTLQLFEKERTEVSPSIKSKEI